MEAFEYLQTLCKTVQSLDRLQRTTLFGIEAKPLPYLLCQMNLVLHGVEAPQIDPLNALRFRMSDIGDRDTNRRGRGNIDRDAQTSMSETIIVTYNEAHPVYRNVLGTDMMWRNTVISTVSNLTAVYSLELDIGEIEE